jgi:hypothetical protein
MALIRSSSFKSATGVASRWSPLVISSPGHHHEVAYTENMRRENIALQGHPVAVPAVDMNNRFHPCWWISAPPASALIRITPSSMSGMMTASTRPLILRRELATNSDTFTPFGVFISAKTTNFRLMPVVFENSWIHSSFYIQFILASPVFRSHSCQWIISASQHCAFSNAACRKCPHPLRLQAVHMKSSEVLSEGSSGCPGPAPGPQ